MASEDFTFYMVCKKQSFLLIDSSSGIFATIFTDSRCYQLLYVYIRMYIGLAMKISRLRLSTPVDLSVPAYSQVSWRPNCIYQPSELRPPFTGPSVWSCCSVQWVSTDWQYRYLSPLVASTGQASDPIRRVTTLLSPVFLLNSRHPLFCDTLLGPPYPEVTGSICRVPSAQLSLPPWSSRPVHLCWFRYGIYRLQVVSWEFFKNVDIRYHTVHKTDCA